MPCPEPYNVEGCINSTGQCFYYKDGICTQEMQELTKADLHIPTPKIYHLTFRGGR